VVLVAVDLGVVFLDTLDFVVAIIILL